MPGPPRIDGPTGPVGFEPQSGGIQSTDAPVVVPGVPPVAAAGGAPDLVAVGRSRLIEQYRGLPKITAEIDVMLFLLQDLANAAVTIPAFDDIDQAGGVNLLATTELVGQGNVIDGVTVSDDFLRILTRLRTLKNRTSGTGPEIIAGIAALFSENPVAINYASPGQMYIDAQVARAPTTNETLAAHADLLPRPAGVDLVLSWYDPALYFGWSDDVGAGATGFGEEGNPSLGGPFAEII